MRSCIYCGRELEKGEKCTCPRSTAGKQQEKTQYNSEYNNPGRTQYQTGYTHKENPFKKAFERARRRRKIRRNNGNEAFLRFKEALADPVSTVQNPSAMSMGAMLLLWAALGAVVWLCIYFIVTNIPRGIFSMIANVMSFNGVQGHKIILQILLTLASGAVSGIILFLIYTAIFYAINRFVFRDAQTSYTAMCQRLALTGVPFTALCVLGALISGFSSVTLMILIMCGAMSFIILTYEALKAQWSYIKPGKIVYAMTLGMFVLFTLISYIAVLN